MSWARLERYHGPDEYRVYGPRRSRAARSGALGIWISPSKGCSSSRTREIALENEKASAPAVGVGSGSLSC
jgi:hypothetical protein